MHLLLINGSPKGERGNSNYLLKLFMEGVDETPGHTHEMVNLVQVKEHARFVDLFAKADAVVMAFPLYTDMMPGIVKAFIESLEPLCGRKDNPAFGFIIQSGFPEAVHMRALEAYLEKLSRRLGCRYLGTALRGGGEVIQTVPHQFIKGFIDNIRALGSGFGMTGTFDAGVIAKFAGTEKQSRLKRLQRVIVDEPMTNLMFWHPQMKRNGAYEQRFARPYSEPPHDW